MKLVNKKLIIEYGIDAEAELTRLLTEEIEKQLIEEIKLSYANLLKQTGKIYLQKILDEFDY